MLNKVYGAGLVKNAGSRENTCGTKNLIRF